MLNASIYVLMLNPGLGPGDYFEYKVPSLRRALIANLRQKRRRGVLPFIFLDPRFAWHGGFGYWDGKLKGVMEALAESKGISLADARSTLGSQARCCPACSLSQRRVKSESAAAVALGASSERFRSAESC